jgi:3-dehydroquinate dehydratase
MHIVIALAIACVVLSVPAIAIHLTLRSLCERFERHH